MLFDGLQNGDWSLQRSIEGIIDGGLGVAEGSCFRDEEEAGKIDRLVDGNGCLLGTLEYIHMNTFDFACGVGERRVKQWPPLQGPVDQCAQSPFRLTSSASSRGLRSR